MAGAMVSQAFDDELQACRHSIFRLSKNVAIGVIVALRPRSDQPVASIAVRVGSEA